MTSPPELTFRLLSQVSSLLVFHRSFVIGGLIVGMLGFNGCSSFNGDRSEDPNRETRQIPLYKRVSTLNLPGEKEFGFKQGIRVGDTIYVSGQGSHNEKGLIVGKGDIEAQLRQAYSNAAKVLQQFGATMSNVVKEEIFVTDMIGALAVAAEVRADVYVGQPLVASTIVQVDGLISPELLVQVKLTAKIHGQ